MTARSQRPIRILLAEDHTIVREGLRALLGSRDDLEVVGEAADGRSAVDATLRLDPDVVVMDLGLPEMHGTEAIAEIRKQRPGARMLVLSMHSGEEFVRSAIRAGANGYLLKGSGLSDLVAAVKAVAAGEAFFSPAVAKVLLEDVQGEERKGNPTRGTSRSCCSRTRPLAPRSCARTSSAHCAASRRSSGGRWRR